MALANPAAQTTAAARSARFGLAAKLFAILILLGAVAVLILSLIHISEPTRPY